MRTWNEAGHPEEDPIHEASKLAKRTLRHPNARQMLRPAHEYT